jgi:hypothetical protein
MREWDPIGVAGVPQAADEYDTYIPGAFSVIHRGGDATAVAFYLDRIVVERMELKPERNRSVAAATALVVLWQAAFPNTG